MKHFKLHFSKYAAMICSVLVLIGCDSCNSKNSLSVNSSELAFAANATDPQSVVVDTDAPGWNYEPSDSWIMGQQSSVILTVTVQPNSSNNTRTGAIKITAGNAKPVNIIVTQEAKSTLSAEPMSLTFEAEDNAEKRVSISTSAQGGWNFTTVPSWISCSKDNNQLVIKVDKNTTSSQRSATISISARSADTAKLTVTQKAPTLTVSPSSLITLDTYESQRTIEVTANTSWTASSSASWLTVSPTSGSNNGSVTVKAPANSGSSRSTTVTFKAAGVTDRTVTVTQPGSSLEVSTSSMNFGNSAQSGYFDITSNVSWTVARSSGSTSWLTVTPGSGSNNGRVTVSASANTGTSARTGTITVSGGGYTRTINVTQAGYIPPTAQVRFRKTSNNTNLIQMAIASTAGDVLAQHVFNTSTGTTSYVTIPTGSHWAIVHQQGDYRLLCWNNCTSETYYFQPNRRYTFEYDGSGYWMRDDGTVAAPEKTVSTNGSLKTLENKTKISELLQQSR